MVAKIILQFAVRKGIKVACSVRDAKDRALLEELGAGLVLDSSDMDSMPERILEATNKMGISTCFDCVGGRVTTELLKSMSVGGQCLFYGALDRGPIQITSDQILFKELRLQPFRFQKFLSGVADKASFYRKLAEDFRDTDIKVDFGETCPLEDYKKALKYNPRGKNLFQIATPAGCRPPA